MFHFIKHVAGRIVTQHTAVTRHVRLLSIIHHSAFQPAVFHWFDAISQLLLKAGSVLVGTSVNSAEMLATLADTSLCLANMVKHGTCRHNYAVQRGLVISFCGQPLYYCNWSYYTTTRFRSLSSHMVSAQPFLDRPRPMPCKSAQMGSCPITFLWLWQTMNHIVDTCPLTKFEGRLKLLHKADDDSLESTMITALAKWENHRQPHHHQQFGSVDMNSQRGSPSTTVHIHICLMTLFTNCVA